MLSQSRSSRRVMAVLLSGVAALALSACASSAPPPGTRQVKSVSIGQGYLRGETPRVPAAESATEAAPPVDALQSLAALPGGDPSTDAAIWAARVQSNPRDIDAQLNFAKALRRMGAADTALDALSRAIAVAPDNADLLAEYGKLLAATGRAQEALPFLSRAAQMKPGDWTILSAEGVALDQTGAHEQARVRYAAALRLSPQNVAVLNNLGLNRAMAGDILGAEEALRQAAAQPGASPRVRQNLALIVGIKGEYAEAEALARGDLNPQQAQNNLAIYRRFEAISAVAAREETPPETPETPPAPATPAAPETPAPVAVAPAPAEALETLEPAAPPPRAPIAITPIEVKPMAAPRRLIRASTPIPD